MYATVIHASHYSSSCDEGEVIYSHYFRIDSFAAWNSAKKKEKSSVRYFLKFVLFILLIYWYDQLRQFLNWKYDKYIMKNIASHNIIISWNMTSMFQCSQ